MQETGRYLFALGATIGGVGLTLLFQGLALTKPQAKKAIGICAWVFGIIWAGMGTYFATVGFAAMQAPTP